MNMRIASVIPVPAVVGLLFLIGEAGVRARVLRTDGNPQIPIPNMESGKYEFEKTEWTPQGPKKTLVTIDGIRIEPGAPQIDPKTMKEVLRGGKAVPAVTRTLQREEISDQEKKSINDANKKEHASVTVVSDPTVKYNCFGYVFKNSEVQLENPIAIEAILRDQGWEKLAKGKHRVGDIVIYRNKNFEITTPWDNKTVKVVTHVGFVDAVDNGGNVSRVKSKWGEGGLYTHDPSDVPAAYGDIIEVYRGGKPLKDPPLTDEDVNVFGELLPPPLQSWAVTNTSQSYFPLFFLTVTASGPSLWQYGIDVPFPSLQIVPGNQLEIFAAGLSSAAVSGSAALPDFGGWISVGLTPTSAVFQATSTAEVSNNITPLIDGFQIVSAPRNTGDVVFAETIVGGLGLTTGPVESTTTLRTPFQSFASILTNGFAIQASGELNRFCQIERSFDLSTWSPLQEIRFTAPDVFVFDADAGTNARAFYRGVIEPARTGVSNLLVSAWAGPGGEIQPEGDFGQLPGANQLFTALPDTNSVIDVWYVDGVPVQTNGSQLLLTNLQADHSVEITFRPLLDMQVVMEASPNPAWVGTNITYSILVTNRGVTDITGINLNSVLNGIANLDSAQSSQGSCVITGAMVNCQLGNLPARSGAAITVTATPTAIGSLVYTATALGSETEVDSDNNTADFDVEVSSGAP